jgi:iron complex outermembrane receptor protein
MIHQRRFAIAAASSALAFLAQAQAADTNEPLEQVVVTGTRVANRSALDTAAPVDVVSSEQLQNVGVAEINQSLAVALPSFNFPRPGLADGTDTIRPAALRGLAPDQTLVLVNGKRRHSASLVNVNGTIGRGSAAVDLNTIPAAMVQSVEVLRDGASAQYGSDAIAGVINLRLREAADGGDATVSYGWRDSTYETITGPADDRFAGAVLAPTWSAPPKLKRSVSDGDTLVASLWKGLSLGDSGFVTVAAEYKDQEHTERGGYDMRRQYPLLPGNVLDPREATFDRFNSWYGEPDLDQKTVFVNAGYDFASGAHMYGWASWQDRDAKSPGFYRLADDPSNRNVIEIYPNGFLPFIAPEVTDYSAAYGIRWKLGDWDMDSSLVYGKNKMEFTIENTLNRSLGVASPTVFNAGGFDYDQLVMNVFGRTADRDEGIRFAAQRCRGRRRRGAKSIRSSRASRTHIATAACCSTVSRRRPARRYSQGSGQRTPAAKTALPSVRMSTWKRTYREAPWIGRSARRALLGFRREPVGQSSRRATTSRAASLCVRRCRTASVRPRCSSSFFQTTSTNFIGGLPFDVTTFPASDPIAVALGAKKLDAEESLNYSIGAVFRFDRVDITIDAYQINIDDRIVLSENLTSAAVRNYLATQGFIGAGGGRFFINGVDTETQGIDVVVNWPFETGAGRFDFTLTANWNNTDVTSVPSTPQLEAFEPAAGAVRSLQHPDVRGRHARQQVHRAGELEPRSLRRDAARHALRQGVVTRQRRDVRNRRRRHGAERHRARRQDSGGPRGSLRHHGEHPRRARRGESARTSIRTRTPRSRIRRGRRRSRTTRPSDAREDSCTEGSVTNSEQRSERRTLAKAPRRKASPRSGIHNSEFLLVGLGAFATWREKFLLLPGRYCNSCARHRRTGTAIDRADRTRALEHPSRTRGEKHVAAEDERQHDRDHGDDLQEAGHRQLFQPHDGRQQRQEEDCGLRIRHRERKAAEESCIGFCPASIVGCSSVVTAGFAVHRRYAMYSRYTAPAYLMTTNTICAVCASAARPVAATENQMRSPIQKPAMKATAPCVPRARRARNDRRNAGPGVAICQQVNRSKDQQAVKGHDTLQHVRGEVRELTLSAGYLIAHVPSPVRQARPSELRERPSRVTCNV